MIFPSDVRTQDTECCSGPATMRICPRGAAGRIPGGQAGARVVSR